MSFPRSPVEQAIGLKHPPGFVVVDIELKYHPIPSKKNQLRPRSAASRGRRHMYDVETRAAIDALTLLAREAWRFGRRTIHPRTEVFFFCANAAQDRDGIWTTVLDCLKRADVIHDDSIRWFNGPVLLHPAKLVPEHQARVVVRFILKEDNFA